MRVLMKITELLYRPFNFIKTKTSRWLGYVVSKLTNAKDYVADKVNTIFHKTTTPQFSSLPKVDLPSQPTTQYQTQSIQQTDEKNISNNFGRSKLTAREAMEVAKQQDGYEAKSKKFQDYCNQQNEHGLSVDIIIGRGHVDNGEYLKLDEEKSFNGKTVKYTPFLIDISPDCQPDVVANVLSLQDLSFIPDNCVNEVYLERIYPTADVILNSNTYINLARILKPGGILVFDFNSMDENDDKALQVLAKILNCDSSIKSSNSRMKPFHIPLTLLPAIEVPTRNELTVLSKTSHRNDKGAFKKMAGNDESYLEQFVSPATLGFLFAKHYKS